MDGFQLLRCQQEHIDILFQTIISEFSRKAPKDPENGSRTFLYQTFLYQRHLYQTHLYQDTSLPRHISTMETSLPRHLSTKTHLYHGHLSTHDTSLPRHFPTPDTTLPNIKIRHFPTTDTTLPQSKIRHFPITETSLLLVQKYTSLPGYYAIKGYKIQYIPYTENGYKTRSYSLQCR